MLSYLFGKKSKKAKTENVDPELAMKECMDEHGEFHVNADGILVIEDYIIFRAIVMRQALRLFAPIKEKLE